METCILAAGLFAILGGGALVRKLWGVLNGTGPGSDLARGVGFGLMKKWF